MMNENRFTLLLIFLIVLVAWPVFDTQAQDNNPEILRRMEEGAKLMGAGRYAEADIEFKYVLKNVDVLPPDICFYFGVNSYYLKQYKQSINWLSKYLELKGTRGQFYDECSAYLDKSNEAYSGAETAKEGESVSEFEFVMNTRIDCSQSGFILCPTCKGSKVKITRGHLREFVYEECKECNDHGYLTCEEYNELLMLGELKKD